MSLGTKIVPLFYSALAGVIKGHQGGGIPLDATSFGVSFLTGTGAFGLEAATACCPLLQLLRLLQPPPLPQAIYSLSSDGPGP